MSRRKKLRKFGVWNVKVVVLSAVLVALSGIAIHQYVVANAPEPVVIEDIDPNIGVRLLVEEFFTDNGAPEMIPIIKCESQFRHFEKDGTVLKNKEGSSAIGVAQILTSKHPDPKVLQVHNIRHDMDLTVEDFDITTIEGNLAYALVLYEVRGTQDWECAKKFRFSR